jgi:hypothetical protein
MITALALGSLLALQGAVARRPLDAPEAAGVSRVVVAAPVYQPDGAMSMETVALSTDAPGVVHLFSRRSICDPASSGATEPADAGFGWRVSSTLVRATADEVVIGLDWQRLWDRGRKISGGPSGTVQLTLHPGDRIPLDHIPNPLATDACRAVGMGLEVRLARTTATPPVDASLLPIGSVEGGARRLDADLWLLHTLPAGAQQAQHQTVRVPLDGAPFAFPAVTLATAQGDVTVAITGSFRRYRSPTGAEFLAVSMSRTITGGRTPPVGLNATTATAVPLPPPGEVVALELLSPSRARAGGGGGRGGAGGVLRSPGGVVASGASGGTATSGPPPAGGAQAGPRQGGAAAAATEMRSIAGGQGGGGGRTAAPGSISQTVAVLEGHSFALRFRVTPVQ